MTVTLPPSFQRDTDGDQVARGAVVALSPLPSPFLVSVSVSVLVLSGRAARSFRYSSSHLTWAVFELGR